MSVHWPIGPTDDVKRTQTKGRCRYGACNDKPGFRWPRSLMRVTEARCPRCGSHLHASSWDYRRGFVELSPSDVRDQLDAAIVRVSKLVGDYTERIVQWQENSDGRTPERVEFNVRLLAESRAKARKSIVEMRARRGRAAKQVERSVV